MGGTPVAHLVMTMTNNPILDELHAARQRILEECKGDTDAYLRAAQARLEASGRVVAQVKQREIRRPEPGPPTPPRSAM